MTKENKKFAVIETGGKQYIVEEGTIVSIEKLDTDKKDVEFKNVLLLFDGKKANLGKPYLNTSVKAEILSQEKDKKVRVFKFKKKTGFRKKQGHRQNYTTVKITSIKSKTTADKSKASDKEIKKITEK